jgi:hypothetical protein
VGTRKVSEYLRQVRARRIVSSRNPLTLPERLAIWIYTSPDEFYREINRQFREDDASHTTLAFASLLNRAIRKLFRHAGYVYRGITVQDLDAFMADYAANDVHTWASFTSSSRQRDKAFDGNVQFIIASKSGAVLGNHAVEPEQEEVLFGTGSKFRVVAVERRDDVAVVELEEI